MNLTNTIPAILSRAIGTKFFLFLSTALILSLTSCDEASVVGLDVQPEGDLLNVSYQDTTSVLTRTVKGDSLTTDETLITTGVAMIGKYKDPVFGTASASLYTQVRLPSNLSSSSFGTAPVCDSVILSLVYEGTYYGKRERKQQTLNVYEVSEAMSISATYYSNSTLSKNTNDLTEANGYVFTPRPTDSVTTVGPTAAGTRLRPQLRTKLDNALGALLISNVTAGNFSSNANFQSILKGLYITTENTTTLGIGEGNILHFRMGDSKITLYYHNSNATNNDSLSYDFSLGSVARFNHFEHDYSSAIPSLNGQINSPTMVLNNEVFIQSMAGVKTKVEFPYLMNWVDSSAISINKAELVLNVDRDTVQYKSDTFAVPNAFLLLGINDDGTTYILPDQFEGPSYYGGSFNSGTLQYKFNISRYIQQVLDGSRNNNGLYVLASNGVIYANRVVLSGGTTFADRPMKLNITFTKLH